MKRTWMETALHVPSKKQMLWGLGCWFMFLEGFSLILSWIFDFRSYEQAYYAELVYVAGCFLLTFVVFFPFLKKARIYLFPSELLKTVLLGFGFYLLLNFAVEWILVDIMIFRELIMEKTTIIFNPNQTAIDTMVEYNPIPMYIGTILLAPVTEELLMRGMVFAPLCRKSPALAYVVSSLIFAGLHVVPFLQYLDLLNFVMLMLIYLPSGIVLGWVYQRTRCIYGPIALHCTMNLYATLMSLW